MMGNVTFLFCNFPTFSKVGKREIFEEISNISTVMFPS